jgi:VanZ family protein
MSRFSDKIAHFLLYFLLVVLGARWCAPFGTVLTTGVRSTRNIVALAVAFTFYAGFDEWLQQFVGRSMSAGDFLADIVGIATAALILVAKHRFGPNTDTGGETPRN